MTEAAHTNRADKTYLPAAGRDWLLPLYDLMTKVLGADRLRDTLLRQAELLSGQRVLDLGCGTGTLAVALKQRYPEIEVVGLDPDPRALERARNKARRAEVKVRFDQGFSDELEYRTASFDRVLSSFMLHHVGKDQKEATMREVCRVLKPGGQLHLVDLAAPDEGSAKVAAFHSHKELKDNTPSRIAQWMITAGLKDVTNLGYQSLRFGFGRTVYYRAFAPA
jgi:ubiquinone/menaquinone biosynthesis C-methylase UbiE